MRQTTRTRHHDVFGAVMPLTERGDVFVIATPGHTVGHQSVVIDLGDRQMILAGDAIQDPRPIQDPIQDPQFKIPDK